MPEGLASAFATPGLLALVAASVLAGLIRGFAGFGSALIFVPVAAQFVPLPVAIVILTITDMTSWPAIVPRALRLADRREVLVLSGLAVVASPVGVWLLSVADADLLQWVVCAVVGLTLFALVVGWRYTGPRNLALVCGIGVAGGLLGGATGLGGPPVILFYLAGATAAAVVRANTILYLSVLDLAVLGTLFAQGLVEPAALWLALVLAIPFVLALLAGQALFRPEYDRTYRYLAYGAIAAAAFAGLPIWD